MADQCLCLAGVSLEERQKNVSESGIGSVEDVRELMKKQLNQLENQLIVLRATHDHELKAAMEPRKAHIPSSTTEDAGSCNIQ